MGAGDADRPATIAVLPVFMTEIERTLLSDAMIYETALRDIHALA